MQMTLRDMGFTAKGQKGKRAFSTPESKFLPTLWLPLGRCLQLPCVAL